MLYSSLCQLVHGTLIVGKCPWCGHIIANGHDVLEEQDFEITDFQERALDQKEVISVMRANLQNANAGVRALAAKYLGEIGPDAKETVPDLTLLLQDKDQLVRDAAEQAIKNIEKET